VVDREALEKKGISLTAESLRAMLRTSTGDRPPTVDVGVRHSDPELTHTAANIIANEFIGYVIEQRLADIANVQAAAAAQGLINVQGLVNAQASLIDSVVMLEPATLPGRPVLPRTRRTIALAVLLGGVLATGLALLLGSRSDTIRSPEELRRRFGVTALGAVFKWTGQDIAGDEMVVWSAPSSGFAESFRQIRANIQFAMAGKPGRTYVVTSPGPEEGKTTVLSNLAVTIAKTGKRVVVVDGDLRRPTLHRYFNVGRREPGLSTFLADEDMSAVDVIHPTAMEGVSIIPSGPIPPNPSELLGSPRMSSLLEQLRHLADVVLVDSPPVLMVADAPIIAAQLDAGIVVVDGFKTRTPSLRAALETLANTQVNLVGVVLNKLKRARFGSGYGYPYYYNYYYAQYGSNKDGETPVAAGTFYKRPATWVRSVLSRRNSSTNGS
jgi:non-specific protein-tyrosine kinase